MNTVLGIDLGTQSLKVVFYDFERREIAASADAPLTVSRSAGGVAEQSADAWLAALKLAMGGIDSAVRNSARSIGVSGQQHGLVAIDASGAVLAPVKLWCDTSTAGECDEIMDAVGGRAACIDKLGNPIAPGYTASKLLWFKRTHPARYAKLDGILLPHDYLNYFLTGERCMEMGDASGTGFLDVRARQWSADLLRSIDPNRDLSECLPTPRIRNEPIGELRRTPAETLDLPAGIPVAIGGGDNMMGAIGTGNIWPGRVTISLGTSGTVYAFAEAPVVDPAGNIAAFCSSTGGWLPLLCTMNCTVTTELMRGLFGANLDAFEAQISIAERGADGILTLPFFNGERTPNLPNARGCIVGLSGSNARQENLLRSAVEGATFALRFGIDELVGLGVSPKEIVLTGGGARSATWRQLVADICGMPVVVLDQEEGAAFGAALQALQLLEPGAEIHDVVDAHLTRDASRSCVPATDAVDDYEDIYRRYQRAVSAVVPMYT